MYILYTHTHTHIHKTIDRGDRRDCDINGGIIKKNKNAIRQGFFF